MLRELKTTLLGKRPRSVSGLVAEHADVTDARDAPEFETATGTPSIGDTDPFRPATEGGDESGRDELSMDRVFTLLGDQRRRYALTYLSAQSEPVTVNELVERVAVWEFETQPEALSAGEREQVHVSMCHTHLPKLADSGAVSYDDQREVVERGDRFERFTHYLCRDE